MRESEWHLCHQEEINSWKTKKEKMAMGETVATKGTGPKLATETNRTTGGEGGRRTIDLSMLLDCHLSCEVYRNVTVIVI